MPPSSGCETVDANKSQKHNRVRGEVMSTRKQIAGKHQPLHNSIAARNWGLVLRVGGTQLVSFRGIYGQSQRGTAHNCRKARLDAESIFLGSLPHNGRVATPVERGKLSAT